MTEFKDHFSPQAKLYRQYRPEYPQALFEFLATQVSTHDLAWDVATGNGQAANALTKYFKSVYATDGSAEQIANAIENLNINYQIETAEKTNLKDQSVDIITVAQALHWFNFDKFYSEVCRVLKPTGAIAVWTYGLIQSDHPELQIAINNFYEDIMGPYWPEERFHIDNQYQDLPFPFTNIIKKNFTIEVKWNTEQFLQYLRTWSSVKNYLKKHQEDPVSKFMTSNVPSEWQSADSKFFHFPISLMLGRISS